jgi:hypothetical protein
VAWADDDDCKPRGRRCKRNRQCCSKNCIDNPSGSGKVCGCPTGKTPCGGRCVTNCPPPKVLDANCQCVCPPGQAECNGSCVSNSCPPGQIFDPSRCACVPECLPNGATCTAETLCCSGTICANDKCCTPNSDSANPIYCTADSECCSGFCIPLSFSTPNSLRVCFFCREPGGSCTSIEDCCSRGGACIDGTCCQGPNGTCTTDTDCCAGNCRADGTCAPL